MADIVTVARRAGVLIPEIMVQAAAMENIEWSVACSILEGESGGGKNIWGADGGMNVRTNGTYKPRTPVTRAAYLAYRTEMRAGRIIRQGAGPCQCTSAQYQDTADALGGTWDPLANCRSGFRGMGALIRKYGVRGGARRYNGSGDAAEIYADRFLARYQKWQGILRGATPVAIGAPAAPPPPPKPKVKPVIQNFPVNGAGVIELNTPIKGKSGLYEQAFVSVRSTQAGAANLWWGLSGVSGKGERKWALQPNVRQWTELDNGDVDQCTIHYDMGKWTDQNGPHPADGVISVEFVPK